MCVNHIHQHAVDIIIVLTVIVIPFSSVAIWPTEAWVCPVILQPVIIGLVMLIPIVVGRVRMVPIYVSITPPVRRLLPLHNRIRHH